MKPLKLSPPTTEAQLYARAQALSGKMLADIATQHGAKVPASLHRHKGWVGELIEKALGAHADHLPLPDFMHLGIELKTLPVDKQGRVRESTFVCTAKISVQEHDFSQSSVWRKMARVLWIPIEYDPEKSIGERCIGMPWLWSPSPEIKAQLQQDWEELTEIMTLGSFDALSAHIGRYLQIRPKAANAKIAVFAIDSEGHFTTTGPKGFYLRANFTQVLLAQAIAK